MIHSRLHRSVLIVALGLVLGLLAPVATSAQVTANDDPGSPASLSNLALTHRLFDSVLNDLNAEAAADLVDANAVIQTQYGTFEGPSGLIAYATAVRQVYPDATFDIIDISVQGDIVEVSWQMTASQIRRAERVFDFDIVLDGVTTITLDGSQITSLTQGNAVVSASGSQEAATVPQRGQPF